MKHIIILPFLLICFTISAQRDSKLAERIKAQKIAFITEKLSLTSQEAQQFWPIYNAYEAEIEDIRSKDLNPLKLEMRQEANVTDQRADKILKKLLEAEEAMHTAKMKLVADLKQVISSKKIILLKAAEDQFNRKLLERLREFRNKRAKRN